MRRSPAASPTCLGMTAHGTFPLGTHGACHMERAYTGALTAPAKLADSLPQLSPCEGTISGVQPIDTASTRETPGENHPAESSQPTKDLVNYCFQPLSFRVIYYTETDNWNASLGSQVLSETYALFLDEKLIVFLVIVQEELQHGVLQAQVPAYT